MSQVPEKTPMIACRIPQHEYDQLAVLAQGQRRSMSNMLALIIAKYLDEVRQEQRVV
jgi:CopG-like RHH_1 or ribbon-helix-helix domain, RHH_5